MRKPPTADGSIQGARGYPSAEASTVGHPAVGQGDRGDPVGGGVEHRVVGHAGLEHHLQRLEGGGGLAPGASHVGLERVAEPAIGVAVGAKGGQERLGRGAVEQGGQTMALEDPAVGVDELSGCVEVDVHATDARRR